MLHYNRPAHETPLTKFLTLFFVFSLARPEDKTTKSTRSLIVSQTLLDSFKYWLYYFFFNFDFMISLFYLY